MQISFFICVEYAEVNIDCESSIRQSPSNRPPAMLPPDARLPNVTNEDQQESNDNTGVLPGENTHFSVFALNNLKPKFHHTGLTKICSVHI